MLHFFKLIILFIVCMPSLLLAATLRFSENFNDQVLNQPTSGGYVLWRADVEGGTAPVTATYPTHYVWGPGRGGSGYSWRGSTVAIPVGDTTGITLLAELYPNGTWPTNQHYVSFYKRYWNYTQTSDPVENFKIFYPRWNPGLVGVHITTDSAYTIYWGVSFADGTVIGSHWPSTQGINLLDGNWHRYEFFVDEETCEFWMRIDGKSIINQDYGDGVCGWDTLSLYRINVNAIDAQTQGDYQMEIDDIEIWDGLPSGAGNVPPTVTIQTPTDTSTYSTTTSVVTLTGSASDSDGSVSSVRYVNTANDSTDTCTGTTSWTCSGIPLVLGVNNIYIMARDDDAEDGSDLLIVTYSQAGDFTAPTVTLVSPTNAYYTASSSTVTITGTASDNVAIKRHDWTCDNCSTTSGTAVGTTSWSISDIAIAGSAYGPELDPGGDFDDDEFWEYEADWSIAAGVATCTGASNNMAIQHSLPFREGALYEIRYDIDSYTSGSLYISQYGFVGDGNSQELTSSVGELTDTAYCRDADRDFRLVSNSWIGSLNYARVYQKGTLNHFVITTYDTSDNTTTTDVYVNYFVSTDRDLSFAGSGGRTVTCCSGSGGRTVSINN